MRPILRFRTALTVAALSLLAGGQAEAATVTVWYQGPLRGTPTIRVTAVFQYDVGLPADFGVNGRFTFPNTVTHNFSYAIYNGNTRVEMNSTGINDYFRISTAYPTAYRTFSLTNEKLGTQYTTTFPTPYKLHQTLLPGYLQFPLNTYTGTFSKNTGIMGPFDVVVTKYDGAPGAYDPSRDHPPVHGAHTPYSDPAPTDYCLAPPQYACLPQRTGCFAGLFARRSVCIGGR